MDFVGLKEDLKVINQLDPQFRRQITKEFKNIADPVIKAAQEVDLEHLALSGFSRPWTTPSGYQMFPLNEKRLDKFVVAGTSGKKPKEFRGRMQNANVFFIRWKSPQATLLEMAARGKLGEAMTRKTGLSKGRVLWRAMDAHEPEVMRSVEELVSTIMRHADRLTRKR